MNIKEYHLVFWDFDGVIKESVDVKTKAFVHLFDSYSSQVKEKIRKHHLDNGGMSRFDKLPLYLKWVGEEPAKDKIEEYCNRFSRLVLDGVISSQWVAGVENYLRSNCTRQRFVLVSATPQDEIELILQKLGLEQCFTNVFGSPTRKKDAINKILKSSRIAAHDSLMIGDAHTDLDAAQANNVPFLLRLHDNNDAIFSDYKNATIRDFAKL